MSAGESITSLPEAVAALGALPVPVPVGPEPRTLDVVEHELTGARLSLYEEELETARLRLALASAKRGRARLRSQVASLNEALTAAAERMRADAARIAELEKREAAVAEFAAERAEYITAIRNCHPDNQHDYDRWQGHAAARRQLSELLGLPVAWPLEGGVPAPRLAHVQREPDGEHYQHAHHDYRVSHDLPETGGTQ